MGAFQWSGRHVGDAVIWQTYYYTTFSGAKGSFGESSDILAVEKALTALGDDLKAVYTKARPSHHLHRTVWERSNGLDVMLGLLP
jgi:hypothetical protein